MVLLLAMCAAWAAPSPEQLTAWAEAAPAVVLPVLDDVLGRHLAVAPPVRVVDQATFLAGEWARVKPQIAAAHPDASEADVDAAATAYVARLAHVTAAYEYDAGALYVVLEPLADTLDFAPLPTESATRAAVECAIAHELAHALQHQEVGPPPDEGAPGALSASAVREGQAAWAGAEVCRRMGQPGAAVWHLLVQGALGSRADADRDLVYRQGHRLYEREGSWALLAAPPSPDAIRAATADEEARWRALGARVGGDDCEIRREFRAEELRIARPNELTPVHDALDDVRWLSWCGLDVGGVGHAVLSGDAEAVSALIRRRLALPGGVVTPAPARGFDAAWGTCADGCTWTFRRGDRLVVVTGEAKKARATARRVLAAR